ncbi:MAG: hypothetical protein Q8O67_05705 [Deltaproteobacteria bacterium]|nr:hypothetical protein [Deltaproteobacteria bacterium]
MTTEARVRVVTRAGALRDAAVVPAGLDPGLQVAVGVEAATDAELSTLERDLEADVAARVQRGGASSSTSKRVGRLAIVRARVKASPGREQHRYVADCRLRLTVDGAVVAEAEADVVRFVRARNLSLIELEAMRAEVASNGGRVPLLQSDDVHDALLGACATAFDAVAFDIRPEDKGVDEIAGAGFSATERSLDRQDQRRRVIDKLEKNAPKLSTSIKAEHDVAAALIDLAAVGVLADATRVAAHLYAESPLVTRAAEAAFTSLCAGQATFAPTSTACVRPEPPPPPLPPTPVTPVEPEIEGDDEGPIRALPAAPIETPIETTPPATTTTDPAAVPPAGGT